MKINKICNIINLLKLIYLSYSLKKINLLNSLNSFLIKKKIKIKKKKLTNKLTNKLAKLQLEKIIFKAIKFKTRINLKNVFTLFNVKINLKVPKNAVI